MKRSWGNSTSQEFIGPLSQSDGSFKIERFVGVQVISVLLVPTHRDLGQLRSRDHPVPHGFC
jgi:hypothetical protein